MDVNNVKIKGVKIIDDFWFGKTNCCYAGLKEFFPNEFVESFRRYAIESYLNDSIIEELIIYFKDRTKDEIFKPGDYRPFRANLDLYSKEFGLFVKWAESYVFKEDYNAYINKQNTILKEIADTETEKTTDTETDKIVVKEKKQTARQRRYKMAKNRKYKVKDMIEKFGNKCSICGYEKPVMNENSELYSPSGYMYSFLQLHHILPIKDGGEDIEENLLCLCPNCHIKIHCGDTDKTRDDLYMINREILI